jgi:hypothetical protein
MSQVEDVLYKPVCEQLSQLEQFFLAKGFDNEASRALASELVSLIADELSLIVKH